MRRLFISYARENKQDVDQLVEHLGLMGYETWVDFKLRGGQQWWDEILRRIADTDVFVVVVSNASLNSTACRREFDWAEALSKPILPVAVEALPAALPRRFAERQIIDYADPTQRHRAALLLQGGLGTVGAALAPPDPLPQAPAAPLSYLTDIIDLITGSDAIDHAQQHQILQQLGAALRSVDPEERRGGQDILERFASRQDLYADVDRIITGLRAPVSTQTTDETVPEANARAGQPHSNPGTSDADTGTSEPLTRGGADPEEQLKTPPGTSLPVKAGGELTPGQSLSRSAGEADGSGGRLHREPLATGQTDPSTSAHRRIAAALIDVLPIVLIYGISFGIGVGTATNTAQYSGMYRRDQTPIGYAAIGIITMLVGLAFTIWNWGYRRSRTGATIGQSTLKLKKSRTPAEKLRAVGNIGTGRLVLLALALGVASVATLFLIRTTIYDQQVCYAGTCYEEGWP